jgi:hypothetical protein
MSSSASARERRRFTRQRPTVTADLIYDGFYAAAVGGSVLGLFFLLVDSADGQPFFTPSLMGTVLFTGVPAESVTQVRLDMVAYMTMIHILLFGLLGMAVAILVHEAELHSRHPKEVILALFLVLEIGFVVSANQFMPGVVAMIGFGRIVVANLVTAATMALFILRSHNPQAWERLVRGKPATRTR